jgi:hypothetical protein
MAQYSFLLADDGEFWVHKLMARVKQFGCSANYLYNLVSITDAVIQMSLSIMVSVWER